MRLLLPACLLLVACGPREGRLAQAQVQAGPHVAAFLEFDAWARRANQTDPFLRDRKALDETTFAPIRHDREVLAAWVELHDRHRRAMSLPERAELPPQLPWVALRHPEAGALQVASQSTCGVDLPKWWRGEYRSCVLISRSQPTPPAGTLVVTMAFKDP